MATQYMAGAYTAAVTVSGGGSASVVRTEEGWSLIERLLTQEVKDDEFGDMVVDAVNLGVDCTIRFTSVDYAALKAAVYANHAQGDPKPKVGTLVSATAFQLVLTPVAGTTAASDAGAYTFTKCFCESDIETLLGSRHRKGPVTLRVLPDPATGKLYTKAGAGGGGA